jgi:acyl carrier protein
VELNVIVDRKAVRDKLEDVFRTVFDDNTIELFDEMTAKDIDEWDSLTHIQLVVAAEKAFKVKFRTGEVSSLKNVGEMIGLLCTKLA